MTILQDLVHLHLKKPNRNQPEERVPDGVVYDPEYQDTARLELVLIGLGALFMLGVATMLSIPDNPRQQAVAIQPGHHDFNIELCHTDLTPIEFEQLDPAMAKLRLCAN